MALTRPQRAARRKRGTVKRGTGAGEYKVQGYRATAKQRQVIDGVLGQCREDNASRRVMVATIMCITQESGAGELAHVMTGNDDVGIFQQGRNWISEAGSKDPAKSTHAFLITGPTSWRKVHRSVKRAPGNLSLAIHQVQNNADPNAYAKHESEAERTVDAWLGGEGGEEGGGSYVKRYTFTRGERGGQREDSWEAAARLVEEVGAFRWAAGNVFYAVSADELNAGAVSTVIGGDEPWLTKQPSWSWAAGRAISEVKLEVLVDQWDVLPGARVALHRRFGAMAGSWLVFNVAGPSLDAPEATITLRRPTRLKSEPPSERASREGDEDGGGGSGGGGDLVDICKRISERNYPYVWGGGHRRAGTPDGGTGRDPGTGYDCSGGVGAALAEAGYGIKKGQSVGGSGWFASSWGKPGKGREFTVYANAGHMFIEFDDGSRFDTSPHGCGPRGIQYRKCKRNDQGRFTARHWSGH